MSVPHGLKVTLKVFVGYSFPTVSWCQKYGILKRKKGTVSGYSAVRLFVSGLAPRFHQNCQ